MRVVIALTGVLLGGLIIGYLWGARYHGHLTTAYYWAGLGLYIAVTAVSHLLDRRQAKKLKETVDALEAVSIALDGHRETIRRAIAQDIEEHFRVEPAPPVTLQ